MELSYSDLFFYTLQLLTSAAPLYLVNNLVIGSKRDYFRFPVALLVPVKETAEFVIVVHGLQLITSKPSLNFASGASNG